MRWGLSVWLSGAVLLVGALLFLSGAIFRQPLAEWLWPETRIQRLLDEGEQALQQGHLSGADGSGARQKFEAAQALDSDRIEARKGLARVGQAALVQARLSMDERRYERAHEALALARALQVPRADADRIAVALREREAGEAGIGSLLQQAGSALREGRLDGDAAAALPLYQRILGYRPGLTEALEGREDALSILLQQARESLHAGDLQRAAALIERAHHYDAGHIELPEARAAFAQFVERQLREADARKRRGRLDTAAELYREIWSVTTDARAQQGLELLAGEYARRARNRAANFRFDEADAALRSARELFPSSPVVVQAAGDVERLRRSQAHLSAPLSSRERQRLQVLLKEAAEAEARGEWLLPPGGSVYDKLRAAQALAPGNAEVSAANVRFQRAVRDCFERELRSNRIRRAQGCYDAWRVMAANDPALQEARMRLAQRWVAIGDERLGAGEIVTAVQALHEARNLDASVAGLEDLATRVRQAQTGNQ
ncbi:MAG: hypothetical protein LBV45_04575 [Xanthomonadaceae bacterium]|nr:hypothetical protein [Xanthomonadaceae bacterium]